MVHLANWRSAYSRSTITLMDNWMRLVNVPQSLSEATGRQARAGVILFVFRDKVSLSLDTILM
jgi:hypothetical protein